MFVCSKLAIFQQFRGIMYCVKSICIRSYSGPHFPRIRTECREIGVSLSIQSECGKNADQNNSEYGDFLRSDGKQSNSWYPLHKSVAT